MYKIYALKCNGAKNPRGISPDYIEFSWKLKSDTEGEEQKQYNIRVWDEEEKLVWESFAADSKETFGIPYKGETLQPHTNYSWQVQSFSRTGAHAVSEKAEFTIGMSANTWNAKWIEAGQERKPLDDCMEMWKMFAGIVTSREHPEEFLNPAVCMRREFAIRKNVKKAYFYASARGIYRLNVDGYTISELFAPGYTTYKKFIEVQQYDVTAYLTKGEHAVGVTLADGWFTGKIGLPGVGNQYGETNAFIMQAEIFYEDGTRESWGTDHSFRWHESELEYADLIVGERYRQDYLDSAWEYAGYEDGQWEPAEEKEYPTEVLKPSMAEPVRIVRSRAPERIFITPAGELVVDVGENIAGVLKVRFMGKEDTVLKMVHSEELDKEGNFLMNIMGQNKNQTDVYVCAHAGEVEWQPYFTFHGFRYVKVEGICKDQLLDVTVQVIATDLDRAGRFACSDARLNRLQENIYRSQEGNMLSIPTDCPQRERAGWTGDMQIYTPTACFNMDMYSFLEKWLYNMRLEQLEDGQIPNLIPSADSDRIVRNSESGHVCSAAWGDACIIIPYVLYWKYGNKKILRDNFDMILKWMQYVEHQAATSFIKPEEEYTAEELERQKYLWNTEFHFGDWLYPSSAESGNGDPIEGALKTKEYVAPAMFAYTSRLMSEICEILGEKDKAKYYVELNKKIRSAYAGEYIDAQGRLPLELQGLYVLALKMELFPQEKQKAGMEHLKELIQKNGNCLDTGFSSISFLLDTLWENGEKELAWKILFQKKCPSWLYEVKMGATTIWESWKAIMPDGTRTNVSYNHFAYGCVGDFMYRKILGLQAKKPGYEEVEICPDFTCGLEWAKGNYASPYGEISVAWENKGEKIAVEVTLPPGVSGILKVPGKEEALPSGRSRWESAVK